MMRRKKTLNKTRAADIQICRQGDEIFPPHERGINGEIYRKRSMVGGDLKLPFSSSGV
jgi:hypothetical protein